jgi:hypothetical protein
MERTTYRKADIAGLTVTAVENKTIILPFDKATYPTLLAEPPAYKAALAEYITRYPELFPDSIVGGWSLYGFTRPSVKQDGLRCRRILTKLDAEVWQIQPAFVMPYMTCDTATADHILFLSKWAPDWALARVFEKDVMQVYRLRTSVGRYSIVGTTFTSSEVLPKHLAADEKHTRLAGEKVYAAISVGEHAFVGGSVSVGAGEADLTEAYRQVQREAAHVDPTYAPETVNTDGWQATINAWKTLFPMICMIQCFLHAVLNLKRVASKTTMSRYHQIIETAWNAYQATTKRQSAQRLRRLREWGETLAESKLKDTVLKLCAKRAWFTPAYDFAQSLRTSNMVDRLMQGLDKYLGAKQYFHGTLASAERGLRAYCLLANFRPYSPATVKALGGVQSPVERINGFTYHDNWLQNMLIAGSVGGHRL